MAHKLVIGLGTGRCGTRSLTKFLKYHGINALHEKYRLVWEPDLDRYYKIIDEMSENEISDVGFYWLPYVEIVIDSYPDAKFICFYRDKKEVIKSFMRGMADPVVCCFVWTRFAKETSYKLCDNVTLEELEQMDEFTREWVETYWEDELHFNKGEIENHFPDFDLTDKKTYMNQYCDYYKKESERLEKQYPENFRIFNMDYALNTKEGNEEILNFIGVVPNTAMQ